MKNRNFSRVLFTLASKQFLILLLKREILEPLKDSRLEGETFKKKSFYQKVFYFDF